MQIPLKSTTYETASSNFSSFKILKASLISSFSININKPIEILNEIEQEQDKKTKIISKVYETSLSNFTIFKEMKEHKNIKNIRNDYFSLNRLYEKYEGQIKEKDISTSKNKLNIFTNLKIDKHNIEISSQLIKTKELIINKVDSFNFYKNIKEKLPFTFTENNILHTNSFNYMQTCSTLIRKSLSINKSSFIIKEQYENKLLHNLKKDLHSTNIFSLNKSINEESFVIIGHKIKILLSIVNNTKISYIKSTTSLCINKNNFFIIKAFNLTIEGNKKEENLNNISNSPFKQEILQNSQSTEVKNTFLLNNAQINVFNIYKSKGITKSPSFDLNYFSRYSSCSNNILKHNIQLSKNKERTYSFNYHDKDNLHYVRGVNDIPVKKGFFK